MGAAANLAPAERAALVESCLVLEALERQASRSRLEAWTRRFLPDLFFAAPGGFHRALYADAEAMLWGREIEGERRTATAIACPRGHGKSTAMVIGLPLWVALEWASMPEFNGTRDGERVRPPYIVIVSDTLDQARSRVMDIRDELESNDALVNAYGDQTPEGGRARGVGDEVGDGATRRPKGRGRKWTETHLELANGVIIRAMGFGSKVRGLVRRGRRPSLILADDMENDQAVETEGRRAKLRRWFTKALIPTGKAGELLTIVVGTILHADSLLARLLSADHFNGWLKRRYAAQYDAATGLPNPDGTRILWPEYWTADQLRSRRREIGTLAYSQEYLNQPIDDETAVFRWDWLIAGLNRGRGRGFLYQPPPRVPFSVSVSTWDPLELQELSPAGGYQVVVTAWDLGIVEDEKQARELDSDYTVGITVGLTPGDRFEVCRLYRRRGMTPAELRARVLAEQTITGSDYVVIERNAAQRIHEIELRAVPGLPIVGHTTTSAKSSVWEGVPGMALMWELGRIDLCHATERERSKVDTLVQELHGLGLEAHDDTVMALWMAVTTIRRWIRRRNRERVKLIGAPPPGYYADPFPLREAA
jgi:hypothetical protein